MAKSNEKSPIAVISGLNLFEDTPIAYDQNNIVKLTPASKRVLFNGEKVELVKMMTVLSRRP